jgi:hypothetical protein
VFLDYLHSHSDCYEDFLRGPELATSPHSCFPAFGLLATLGCMISFADCTGSSLQQPAQLSLFSLFLRGERLSEKNTIFASNPTPPTCCHVLERIVSYLRPVPSSTFQQTPPVSDRGCLRANTFPTDSAVMYEIFASKSQTAGNTNQILPLPFVSASRAK